MRRGAAVAAAMLAVMGAAAMQGQARASVPGDWNKAFQSRLSGEFTGIAAISRNNAWAVGQIYSGGKPSYTPYIRHFDGSGWNAVTIPGARFLADTAAASSASDVWVFGHAPGAAFNSVVYRYDGSSWHKVPVPSLSALQHPVVLSPSSVWAYGYLGGSAGNVFHWNGSRWQAYNLSLVRPEGLSASSGSNVWVSGVVFSSKTRQIGAYRWTGSRWQYVSMPHPASTEGAGVTASSASDVWIGWNASPTVSRVMHWDGRQWLVTTPPPIGANTFEVVPDGRGGDWFGPLVLWTGQQWIEVGLSPDSANGGVGPVVRVPGTSMFWLPGGVTNIGSSTQNPTIYRYDLP